MRKMAITDAFFLIHESRRTPMHVGGVNVLTLPDGADEQRFLAEAAEVLRYEGELRHPFGERLKMTPLGPIGPVHWEPDTLLDMDYHIRHSALPKPGHYRELFTLVSRLHSTLLDRNRPMWEMHLIEGLPNRQFATYFKVHHCAIDGVGAMHLTNSMLSTDKSARIEYSPYSMQAYQVYKNRLEAGRQHRIRASDSEIQTVAEALKALLGSTANVGNALLRYAGVWLGMSGKLSVPFHRIPETTLNTQISGARRFVAQSWPFERVRAVGKAFGGTLNDAVLAMCAGALRRQLLEHGGLPKHSLKAMAPMSLRDQDDVDSANAVGYLTADLATNIEDPAKRFRAIQASMQAGKDQLSGMTRREIELYTVLTQVPALTATILGLASRFPAFSIVISNIPGPRQTMYWNGARLDGMYPVSIPFDGFAMNITLVSQGRNLDFGIVACRRSVPHLQHIIEFMDEALVELEEAADIRVESKAKPKSKVKSKAGATTKTAARPRRKVKAR